MGALTAALDALKSFQALQAQNTVRKAQVGSGMRGDKRRTYRFQDNTVADHVTGCSARCSDVMRGGFDRLWK